MVRHGHTYVHNHSNHIQVPICPVPNCTCHGVENIIMSGAGPTKTHHRLNLHNNNILRIYWQCVIGSATHIQHAIISNKHLIPLEYISISVLLRTTTTDYHYQIILIQTDVVVFFRIASKLLW